MMQPSLMQRILRRLDKTLASLFTIDQWVILTTRDSDFNRLQWEDFKALIPEKDRYWSDPFVLHQGERYHVFVEEKIRAKGRGRIACLTLDEEGRLLQYQPVLQRDYHLSYPFVFEHEGQIFMMPESAANRTIEVYRCTHIPDQWELYRTLMQDVYAVDATLLESNDRWWLFANIKQEGGSSLNSLHLFWSTDPFSASWTPHPRNPIVRDIRSARPAGRIFQSEGQLIRPSQDCLRRYGYAIRFNRITKLTEDDYREETVSVFTPDSGRYRATHTYNQDGGLAVIDAVLRRSK